MPRAPKTSLSKSLENKFFEQRLSKQSIQRLKNHCVAYQDLNFPKWTSELLPAYSSYLGFLTALKTKTSLNQLLSYGYLENVQKSDFELLDFGAGTLGASLGAYDFFKEQNISPPPLTAVDRQIEAVEWASKEFCDFLPQSIQKKEQIRKFKSNKAQIIIMANVLSEVGFSEDEVSEKSIRYIKRWLKETHPDSILVILEPSTKTINLNLLRLRDSLDGVGHILLPCTHQLACPALAVGEWCHEERGYAAPTRFWELVKTLGFRKQRLSYSFLCLGQQESRFKENQARVISGELPAKGKSEKWLCSRGIRWKESKLDRTKNEQNLPYFEARRGSIIDCDSTQSHPKQ